MLLDLGRGVANEVHAGAVAAVLGARRHELGQHLGGVAVGQALDHPHLGLVQRVALGVRVARPLRVAVGADRHHVAAHRVGEERLGEVLRRGGRRHRVQHLRRQQHRHGGQLGLVGRQLVVEVLAEQVTHDLAELLRVLHAVHALPLRVAPLRVGDVAPAGEPPPVGLDQLLAHVGVRLVVDALRRGHDLVKRGHTCSLRVGSRKDILSHR